MLMCRTAACWRGSSATRRLSRSACPGYVRRAVRKGSRSRSRPLATYPRTPFSRLTSEVSSADPAPIACWERSARRPADCCSRTATTSTANTAPRRAARTPPTSSVRMVRLRLKIDRTFPSPVGSARAHAGLYLTSALGLPLQPVTVRAHACHLLPTAARDDEVPALQQRARPRRQAQHPRRLAGDPGRAERLHAAPEVEPLLDREVAQDGGVEDDERRLRRRVGATSSRISVRSPRDDVRRVLARDGERLAQVSAPARPGPARRATPASARRPGRSTSSGSRSMPLPPDDLRHPAGQRRRDVADEPAVEQRRPAVDDVLAVAIAVAVGQEAQPGARPDLQQRERPRQPARIGSMAAQRAGSLVCVRLVASSSATRSRCESTVSRNAP